MKLFLHQFGINACVLNSELPAKMRCHAVSQFNQGIYDIIVASDELVLDQPHKRVGSAKAKASASTASATGDRESGVARGIDFHCVSNVVNFDFPLDVSSYIHRAGRTARGNNTVRSPESFTKCPHPSSVICLFESDNRRAACCPSSTWPRSR